MIQCGSELLPVKDFEKAVKKRKDKKAVVNVTIGDGAIQMKYKTEKKTVSMCTSESSNYH